MLPTDQQDPATPLELHAFEDSQAMAASIRDALGDAARLRPVEVHHFPDGESRVRVESEGAQRAVVVRSLADPNARLVELLLAADALRRRGVDQLCLVAPYLGYMRQDRAFREGEAVSQQVVARLLSWAFDRVITVEAHLHRIARLSEVFTVPAESLSAAPLVARRYRGRSGGWRIIGPDEESEPWVREVAERAGLPHSVCRKQRAGDRSVRIEVPPLGDTRHAVVVDDIASSGATLAEVARALHARGVPHCEAVVVHALFGEDAASRMRAAGLDELVSTDTLPHPTNRIPVGPLIAEALARPPGPEAGG
jgi:ribose-phosphate pyrophosphokinase